MTLYRPGQVSATLFASTKTVELKNDSLAKLFSSTKSSTHVMGSTVVSYSQVFPAPNSINDSGLSPESKIKKKKKKKTEIKGPQNEIDEESRKHTKLTLPNALETVSQQKQADVSPGKSLKRKLEADVSPGKSLKRKLEKDKNADDDQLVKRPRRNRKREKDADNRTIFVGNCPLTADKKTLKKLFREFGEIETIRFRCAPSADPNLPKRAIVITKNFHEKCNNFVSFIVYKDEEAAKKALVRNGYLLDGLHLRVDIAALSKKHDKKRSIFVGNLPFTISEEVIRGHFCDCGDITNVRIVRDRATHLGKGICYVQFESKDSVGLALKLNKSEVQGRPIRVMVCTNKPKKKEEQTGKKARNSDKSVKSKAKKMTFAPSNVASSKFQTILKTKKERRFRKMKKKKENAKKQDGLSSIFGDMPAASKSIKFKRVKKDKTGKHSHKSLTTKKKPHQKGNIFKGKGKGKTGKRKQ